MSNTFGLKLVALGLTAASGLGLALYPYYTSDGDYQEASLDPSLVADPDYAQADDLSMEPVVDGTETVSVPEDELEASAAARTASRTSTTAGDPTIRALLRNATVRRALARVGPDLLADPQVRRALETGRIPANLVDNPTVTRALMMVGPSLMADPQVARAMRSGRLQPARVLRDPAVRALIRQYERAPRVASRGVARSMPTRHARARTIRRFERAPVRTASEQAFDAVGQITGFALDLTGLR